MTAFSQRFTGLSNNKRELLRLMLREEGTDISQLPIQPRNPGITDLPLSYVQQRMWFLAQLPPDTPYPNNLPSAVRLIGPLSINALEQTFNEIIRRHEALRTSFPAVDGKPVQKIAPGLDLKIPVVDMQNMSEAEQEKKVRDMANKETLRPFDLNEVPMIRVILYKLKQEEHLLLLIAHHIIWDGWSIGLLTQEMAVLYEAFSNGKTSPLPDLQIQYADYALWQRDWLKGEYLEKLLSYWREKLEGVPDLNLPTDHPRPAVQTYHGRMQPLVIPGELLTAFEELSRKHETTLFMTLLAAFQVLLSRYSGQDDIIVGTPVANRQRREIEGLIGCFASVLVVCTDLSGDPDFTEVLSRVKDTALEAYAHQDIPLEMLVEKLQIKRDPGRNPLFQVMFGMHQDSLNELKLPGLALEPVTLGSETTHFDMGLHLWTQENSLNGYITYSKDLFDQDTIARVLSHFLVLLAGIAENPDRKISALPILTKEEEQWLQERNQERNQVRNQVLEKPAEAMSIHAMFEARAGQTPDAVALVCPEKKQISFRELDERASQLAHYLQKTGSEHNPCVGICMEPCVESVVGMLGALKAGQIFVPLDPRVSAERLSFMLKYARVNLLLTREKYKSGLSEHSIQLLCLDHCLDHFENQPVPAAGELNLKENPWPEITPESPAYVFFTSDREGILADHRRVCQRLGQLQEQFALSDTDSMLVQAYPGQDSFIWETLWPLMFGGRLIFPGPGDQENSLSILSSAIAEQSVSYIHFTPEALLLFLKSWGDESVARLGSLRHVLCSGGLLQRGAVKTFFRRMNCGLTYLYNPPEAAFEIGFHACQPGMSQEVAPAGKPGSALVYILDQNHNLVPIGVPGEICTKAEGLTPLKLKEKNFPLEDENSPLEGENPPEGKNSPLEGGKGGVWIKTGDKGRWLADGTLELTDCPGPRVWKDGVRFNLSEIETALLGHPSVEECHVLSRTANQFHDQDQTREIVSCIAASKPFSTAHIREYLRSCVPPAMIPGAYVPVNSIPLTNEGKADERILTGLEVTDDDLIQRWETGIRSLPEIDQVKVMIREKTIPQSLLHISDVLPGWQAAKAIGQFSTTMLTDVAHREQTGQEPKAMAFSDGGPLHIPEHAPKTLTRALICTARDQKDQGIIVLQDEDSEVFQSYAELLESAKCILAGLQAQGSEPGDAVILQIENMQDHFSAFWACVLGGIIPLTVAIDTSYSQKTGLVNKLWNSWELLDHPPVLASSHLESALSGLPKLFREDSGKLKEFRIISVEQLKQNPPTGNIYESRPEEVAFYQLSSGSTGIPKCIMETHKGAVNYIHGAMAFGNKPEDITVNWLPMDHVVPLLTCHIKDTYMGSVQIHASTRLVLANPLIWLDLVEKYKATYAWAPNFGFKLLTDALSREPGRKWDVSTLEFVLTGGEQITMPVIKETIDKLVPFGLNPSSMRSGYGMAESGTVVVHPNRLNEKTAFRRFLKSSLPGVLQETEDEGEHTITFTNIGRPKAGAQFRAADLENNILPECVIGRLQIKGDMVTPGYLNNEEANQESFVGDGWYNTGDLCFIKDGSMSIIGREKETIIICGANFYCYEIEDVVNSIEGVEPTFSAACAVDSPDSGTEGLAVFFVPQKSEQKINIPLLQSVRENIAKDLGVSPTYVIPLAKDEFPKTTSGKIQRSQLKKALARGEFDTLLKKIEIASKGPDTLPEWFFRQVWQRKELPKEIPGDDKTGFLSHQTGVSLVFLDKLKLGALMCDKSEQYHYVRVEPGTGFLKLNPRHYQINPREPEHYENLISSVTQDNIRIHQILHLWTYDKHKDEISGTEALEDAQYSGVYSLLSLTRALVRGRKDDDAHSIRMLVISSYTQSVSPGDKIAIERTPVLGLVKTISQEISWLDCRHTDLPVDANNVSAGLILRESRTTAKDRETAFRQGQRRIPKLEKLEFSDKQELPFKQDEVILISGGLGGIGIEIARYLLKNHKSRLILVGRTPLSDSEVIPAQADSLASGMSVPERVKVLQELKQIGEVIYEAADVCDLEQMQQIVSQGKKRWHSDLSGVIHLAGTFPTRLLSEETVESFAKTLGPKMLGSWILRQLVSEQGFFISFGSLFGFFGGVATGAYSAANSFLDAFSHYQQETEKKKSYCFSWTNWDEVGMSRGYLLKEQSRSQGYYMIPANKGILSLLAGLHSAHPRIMIGLDSGKPAIQRYMKSPEVCQSRELAAYFTAPEGSSPMAGMPDIRDRFGTPSRCEFIRIPEMPLTESGEIDISKLSEMDQKSAQASAERITPRTGLERTIGAIWQEVLNVENVGIHQNFFEMGGQSILLIRVQKKLQSAFNRDVSVVELLRYPTISSLAKYMSQEQKQKSSFQEAKERAEKQKSARRKKSRPKRR